VFFSRDSLESSGLEIGKQNVMVRIEREDVQQRPTWDHAETLEIAKN